MSLHSWAALYEQVTTWLAKSPTASVGIGIATAILGEYGTGFVLRRAREYKAKRLAAGRKMLREDRGLFTAGKLPETPNPDWWLQLSEEASITAVVSGKGGVGKSLLSLALTEYYSTKARILLVDFDLQNMGLSSMLDVRPTDASLFNELETFDVKLNELTAKWRSQAAALGQADARSTLAGISKDQFLELRDSYTLVDRAPRKLKVTSFDADDVVTKNDGTVQPRQCYFLSSRIPPARFLASDQSRMDYVEVALFLKCLANWAWRELRVERIILDCHGGQDNLMVGAVLASSALVVVATSEPGAVDGTCELIRFTQEVIDEPQFRPRAKALIINKCDDTSAGDHRMAVELFSSRAGAATKPIQILADDSIAETQRFYTVPSCVRNKMLWPYVRAIAKQLGPMPTAQKSEPNVALKKALETIQSDAGVSTFAPDPAQVSSAQKKESKQDQGDGKRSK